MNNSEYKSKSFGWFSLLVLSKVLFFDDIQVFAVTFGKSDAGLLVSNDEDVASSGGQGLSVGISQMHDVETTQMPLNVKDGGDSADVVASGNVGKVARFVGVPFDDGVLLKVELESVTLVDLGVGVSDGPSVVGDDVWDFVGSDSLGLDLQELDLGFGILDLGEGEPSLDVVEHSVVLVGLDDGKDVHDTDGEFSISSDFIIDFDASLLVLSYGGHFASGECDLEVVSASRREYLRTMERGRHSLSLWGPWLGLVALMPPILESSHERGVFILLRCFLGPLAIEYL